MMLNLIRYHGQLNLVASSCLFRLGPDSNHSNSVTCTCTHIHVCVQVQVHVYVHVHVHVCGIMMRERFTHQHLIMVWVANYPRDMGHDPGVASIKPSSNVTLYCIIVIITD